MPKLIFGKANAKLLHLEPRLGGKLFTFSLLSGINCPYAKECKSQAVEVDGKLKIVDGPDTIFRCFSASQEALYKNVYSSRKHNADTILPISAKSVKQAADVICENLPKKFAAIRIHVGGDFTTKNYFAAWNEVAKRNPNKIFYAYTKSLPFWVSLQNDIAANFILTASYGGYKDNLIAEYNLRSAKVVFSETEASELGLEIDHDDSHAAFSGPSFALLIHGQQPKASKAAKAVKALNGVGSYGRGTK